jgi:hypothetical protein
MVFYSQGGGFQALIPGCGLESLFMLFYHSQIPGPILGHWITCLPGTIVKKPLTIIVCHKDYRVNTLFRQESLH